MINTLVNDLREDARLGDFLCGVAADRIEALEARCRELEVERDFWNKKALELARKSDNAQAHAQKLTEALEKLVHSVCGETGFANAVRLDSGLAYPWHSLEIAEEIARSALSLTPTSALAAVRDEVREEAVQRLLSFAHSASSGIDIIGEVLAVWKYPNGHPQWQRVVVQHMSRDILSVISAELSINSATIRARKETGE